MEKASPNVCVASWKALAYIVSCKSLAAEIPSLCFAMDNHSLHFVMESPSLCCAMDNPNVRYIIERPSLYSAIKSPNQ
jgi:hypothetical protein